MLCVLFRIASWGILMRTQNIPISITKKESHPKLSQICSYGIFTKGLKNEFETTMANESSVFEPLRFYCILYVRYEINKKFLEEMVMPFISEKTFYGELVYLQK